jgi:hypothetical protein
MSHFLCRATLFGLSKIRNVEAFGKGRENKDFGAERAPVKNFEVDVR